MNMRVMRRLMAALLAALALCAAWAAALAEDLPQLPQPIDWAFALPEPVLARFDAGLRFDVYSGPGTSYVREANGRASVSTNDWVLVFGEENGWLMIAYRVNDETLRVGYIQATQGQARVRVPALSWAGEAVLLYDRLSSDPTVYRHQSDELATAGSGTLLGALGDEWGYVQSQTADGVPLRGFIHIEGFAFRTPQAQQAWVSPDAVQTAALYDAPGGAQVATLYPGANLSIREEGGGMLRVVCRGNEQGNPILRPVAEGWIDARAVTRGADGWTAQGMQGSAALRVVSLDGTDAVYALVAEAGETAYLEGMADGRGTLADRAAVRAAPSGMLYAWDGQDVPLFGGRDDAAPVRAVRSGASVYVIRQEGGRALVALAQEWGMVGWTLRENVIPVM